jgi:hypothetical protein
VTKQPKQRVRGGLVASKQRGNANQINVRRIPKNVVRDYLYKLH